MSSAPKRRAPSRNSSEASMEMPMLLREFSADLSNSSGHQPNDINTRRTRRPPSRIQSSASIEMPTLLRQLSADLSSSSGQHPNDINARRTRRPPRRIRSSQNSFRQNLNFSGDQLNTTHESLRVHLPVRIFTFFTLSCCFLNFIYQASYAIFPASNANTQSKKTVSSNLAKVHATGLGSSVSSTSTNPYELNAMELEKLGSIKVRKLITAYTEPHLQDTVSGTGSRGSLNKVKEFGEPPKFIIPLPRRTTRPEDLKIHVYDRAQTCFDLPGKFPVDQGLQFDENGKVIFWNVGNDATPPDFPIQQAKFCPVELDPFLPWIHDVFPTTDGKRIEFIAQNMRRCRTGKKHTDNVNRLVPQVALFQSVSVQIINETVARSLAPDVYPASDTTNPRYRLAPREESDVPETRFICRFKKTATNGASVTIGETHSVFPFNYEYANHRKEKDSLLSPRGKDGALFWTSTLHFYCPVPPNDFDLQAAISEGSTVLRDGTATLHVDLIPIRTSVRYKEHYLTEDMVGPVNTDKFDPVARWGPNHVIPPVEASGRWENIPICFPPQPKLAHDSVSKKEQVAVKLHEDTQKPYFLSACLWASAEFKHRGQKHFSNTDTIKRLREWIEFHLLVGFDHIYIYDNTGAHTNSTSLEPIVNEFPPHQVTRIDWPSIVCNNNKPSDDSEGERSSQYAAESSCLARYGPSTEWISSFDTDEYFVPMGNYSSLKEVLLDAGQKSVKIMSFRSSRGKLRLDASEEVNNGTAIRKSSDSAFLQAYNCDGAGSPKPSWAERARKQIYRSDYVLHHFVHYSTVTKGMMVTYKEHQQRGLHWYRRHREREPSEMYTDEVHQAVMVHTKSVDEGMTNNYKKFCRYDYEKKWRGCHVAFPFPKNTDGNLDKPHNVDGMEYNCHINEKVEQFWLPRLRNALSKRKKEIHKHSESTTH